MRFNYLKATLKTAVLAVSVLLLGAGVAVAQVNLTAAPTSTTLPDGTVVPMWGYSCGAVVAPATCLPLNPASAATATTAARWSPVVITVPTGQALTINLTNSLSFLNGNSVPTSLTIVGQLGGGLGTTATSTPSPDHSSAQQVTWPIANPGVNAGTPPTQGNRVQSFSTEVAAGATTATALCWGPTCTSPSPALRPGTYLIESGTHPSIQGPMGLYGILVVTTAPVGATAGTAYPGSAVGVTPVVPAVTYNAEVPLLLSEIDSVQNTAVSIAVNTAGFHETTVWSGQPGGCGNPSSAVGVVNTCYPPAVNYTPLYYLINGVAFNKTSAGTSLFAATPGTTALPVTGSVLVRIVNAGLRMHVPSIIGSQIGTAVSPATVPPSGFSLIAEDGNRLPGVPRVQSEVFMAAGKTYDVMINVPAAGGTALPVYDRELSLSGNAIARDAGMLAYIGINGTVVPAAPVFAAAAANNDTYNSVVPCTLAPCTAVIVSDPGRGVIANDVNVYGVKLFGAAPTNGTLTLSENGTFTFVPNVGTTSSSFVYIANSTGPTATCGTVSPCATVTLGPATLEAASGITMGNIAYTSNVATSLSIKSPGVLSVDSDGAGFPLTVDTTTVAPAGSLTLAVDASGGFVASVPGAGTYTFTYRAKNSQGTQSATAATVTLTFQTASGLSVTVLDGQDKKTVIADYRWIIEEDRTFYMDPNCTTTNPTTLLAGCPAIPGISTGTTGITIPLTFGTNFHTSHMPVVATGCVGPTGATVSCEAGQKVFDPVSGTHLLTVCDIGNGVCRTTGTQETPVDPSQVHLDPTKRYYFSVLPGDAANYFQGGTGHGMGGAPIAAPCPVGSTASTCTTGFAPITVLVQPTPFAPSKLSVFVFQDDFPLNGEHDAGGGTGTVNSNNEPGLGQFSIVLYDDAGGPGDVTGQMSYDMFNQPLSNSLAGTIDPLSGKDACPISVNPLQGVGDPTQTGISGMIVTCPEFESDGITPSPLAGQAVIANLMPGRFGVVARAGADRIARGEEWLQTNTLDGQKAHDSFLRIGEPSFFQEYGPAGYHVSIGFANPKIINKRLYGVCHGTDPAVTGTNCTNTVTGMVTTERMSRTPDERLYSSGDNSSFAFTQCYVSFGDPDGEDFAFTKCNGDGSFSLSGLPNGDWRITVFDQWNDMLVDGLSTPVRLAGGTTNLGQLGMNQWQANFATRTFFDLNGDGVSQSTEPGLALVKTNVRFRDGSFSNRGATDLNGYVPFNEEFPLFSWYVIETDVSRYKNTGTHVVYDAGGPSDGSTCGGTTGTVCGNSVIGHFLANTAEQVSLPANLRVPGAVYCGNADCTGSSIATGPVAGGSSGPTTNLSTGRIDPPWVLTEAWQGFSGQNNFLEFGKKPYAVGENGGIRGHVVYSSTRPFDDPQFGTQNVWEPLVPGVTINLYKEGTAADHVTPTLTLVDHTTTTSWDDWAQGFRSDGIPNMNCPGQGRDTGTDADLFFFSLNNQPSYLNWYNSQHGGPAVIPLPANSQFKCYDGMHNWNQLQPAPYDGMYQFPSVTGMNPTTGKPTATNCTGCTTNPDATDPYRSGLPMLPAGKYVVEMVVPPGFELTKEEDKNILIGDNFIAPVTVQFPGLGGSIYILPDQAAVASTYNANSAQNPTQSLGRIPTQVSHEGDTPTMDTFWPCVGALRIVPDYMSIFPQSLEVAPFAGASRNLCDRKEVTLDDQASEQAEFFVFTETPAAAHFTGVITDDFTSEFDPFSPQFGEKFSPPNLPVSIKDWSGTEISRIYSDHWGSYDGLTYSSWEVNPPNPTGYSPQMMVTCMNDPGPIPGPGGTMVTDPLFNPQYSQFCYEIPFMPGATQYMDTPVVPTSAFAGAGYNNPDCAYPALTPAIGEVDGAGIGPWVAGTTADNTLHIYTINGKNTPLGVLAGVQTVPNNAYSGPSATTAPYNQKTVTRNYGFGTTKGTVSIGGVTLPSSSVSWSNTAITVTGVGTVTGNIPLCGVEQQVQYGGTGQAQCGELVITTANTAIAGQPSNAMQSIDTVTVTVGGKTPTLLTAGQTIQSAIDAAAPGDMIIVPPGTYNELLIMWKPVRLQGVGAASSIINANSHPSSKVDTWRKQVNCLFGLALNGSPVTTTNPYDSTGTFACPGTGWNYYTATANNPQVDRLPLEAVVGWDAELNGNLAELLQEPSLMGSLEGAGITVLAKGVNFPTNPFDPTLLAGFPTGTTLLTGSSSVCKTGTTQNPFPSNFYCNPSSIDGLGITNSSQGGGAIFVHGWGHKLQIANNRIYNNAGTLSGGVNLGQGEFPPATIKGSATNAAPYEGTSDFCAQGSVATNAVLPYCFNVNVNIHHNYITANSSTGDELFSATPAGAGGVSICTGNDYYLFDYNWVCGNLSSGDGGGFGHMGFSYNGDIEHNSILFNQSTNPTIPSNGGGMIVMGSPDADIVCNAAGIDQDCTPPPTAAGIVAAGIGPSDGTGPNLVINANLIMGNAAESGSGGGIAFQAVNGSDMVAFPTNSAQWNKVTVTNNIISNNVAGWDGAGISLVDAVNVDIINNTIMHNDTTASSGVLFSTLNAPLASVVPPSTPPVCTSGCGNVSTPQPAGLVVIQNSAILTANLPATVACPTGHPNCRSVSTPLLANDVFWQNRDFNISVGGLGTGTLNQQHVVALLPTLNQTSTGQCLSTTNYWDIGVRGDTGPTNHAVPAFTLAPTYSILTNTTDYSGALQHNAAADPAVVSQYCNGSRVPPEFKSMGYQVPPGISDATVPNPIFNLTPAATVDEGNNWINISWGPLAETNPVTGATLGNYAPAAATSPVVNYISQTTAPTNYTEAPNLDFFNNARKNGFVDAGAVEFQPGAAAAIVTGGPLAFGSIAVNTTSVGQMLTLHNTGGSTLTGITVTITAPFSRTNTGTFPAGAPNCLTTLAAGTNCSINVVFSPTAIGPAPAGTATIAATGVAVSGSPVGLSGTGFTSVVSLSLIPTTWTIAQGRNCPGTGFLQITLCSIDPMRTFTLTNTSNVPVTGVGAGVLGVVAPNPASNVAEYHVVPSLSTCGTIITTLAPAGTPAASCTVTVQFQPQTAQSTGLKDATISVTTSAGTQTSILDGTALP